MRPGNLLRVLGGRAFWVLAVAALASGCGSGTALPPPPPPITFPTPNLANVAVVSADPFTNATSQHQTQVEPDAFAFGTTIVAAFQSGRFFTAGSSDIMFATSHDSGATWTSLALPGLTNIVQPGSPFDSVSDPAVAYDAKHAVWLISSLPVVFSNAAAPAALVSRSPDGLSWSAPVAVAPGQVMSDKDWIVCDDTPASPFYGHCYVEWDDPSRNGLILMSTSVDGGLSWTAPAATANNAGGIGGQPLVQPSGTVVVPIADYFIANQLAFTSHDGGASWSTATTVAPVIDHFDDGGIRSGALPSAAVDAAGTMYLVWQDCRFRAGCNSNDIVMSTSANGVSWTPVARVPIDPVGSGVDHFLPGIGIAPGTSGAGARLGITYYYYSNAGCGQTTCRLNVGFISSLDGGLTWGAPVAVAGPMSLVWLAQTNQGSMVGDYSNTVYVGLQPHSVFAVARPPSSLLSEAMYVPRAGVISAAATLRRSGAHDRPVPGARSDHPPRILQPIRR